MQKSNSKHYYNSKKLQKLISTYQLYSTDKKSVPKNMETKYLRIFTFIFKKNKKKVVTFFSRRLLYSIDCSQNFHIISTMIHIYASTDRSVYNSRSVDLYDIDLYRSSEMDQVDQYMLRGFFVLHNDQDRSIRSTL